MDNITFLQLIMSDGVFTLELLALFAVGFYLILAIMAYPVSSLSPRNLSSDKIAPLRGMILSPRNLSSDKIAPLRGLGSASQVLKDRTAAVKAEPVFLQIGLGLGTMAGVGAVVSPPRTWLRQGTNSRR